MINPFVFPFVFIISQLVWHVELTILLKVMWPIWKARALLIRLGAVKNFGSGFKATTMTYNHIARPGSFRLISWYHPTIRNHSFMLLNIPISVSWLSNVGHRMFEKPWKRMLSGLFPRNDRIGLLISHVIKPRLWRFWRGWFVGLG